ncbi:basic proline-rich protein-like [Falco peregrinus]|uniref:basic proline-rich protein-like n=1 Tax=Falco peregrinus TaxID=8954 RepID=UPI00247B0122|nr:basic proline-rich protein-like [Falco peregrinus]
MAAAPPSRPPLQPGNGRLPPHSSAPRAPESREGDGAAKGASAKASPRLASHQVLSARPAPQPPREPRPPAGRCVGEAGADPPGLPGATSRQPGLSPPPAPADGPGARSPPRATMTEQRAPPPLPPRGRAVGGPAPLHPSRRPGRSRARLPPSRCGRERPPPRAGNAAAPRARARPRRGPTRLPAPPPDTG